MQQSRLAYALLGMLMRKPMTGYDMTKQCESDLAWFWYGSFGQIYPLLKRMLSDGWVELHEEPGRKGRPKRKVYSITAEGKSAFQTWLSEPPVEDLFRSELLIKLHFGTYGDPSVMAEWLEGLRQRSLQIVAMIEEMLAHGEQVGIGSGSMAFQKILGERGLIINQGMVEWCERSLDTLHELIATGEEQGKV